MVSEQHVLHIVVELTVTEREHDITPGCLCEATIESDSMRAIKLCALLAMYNIFVKARVVHAYIGEYARSTR